MTELSLEFQVGAKIYEFNKNNEPVWFTKLCESLEMQPKEVMRSLRTLFDWGIVKGEYGATSTGRAGRLLYITSESKQTFKEIYEKYCVHHSPSSVNMK